MNIETIREYCLKKKGTVETVPFGPDYLVMKVVGKMYILIRLDVNNCITVKCNPEYAIELRERYSGIEPAWHFNKKYWNQIWLDRDVDDTFIMNMIDHSYDEVLKKLSRKERLIYEGLPG